MTTAAQIIQRRRKRQARRSQRAARGAFWGVIFGGALLLLVVIPAGIAFGSVAAVYADAARSLPEPGTIFASADTATTFYDASGDTLVYTLNDSASRYDWVDINTLPPQVVNALLASEDPDFRTEPRDDAGDTLLKLWENLLIGTLPPDISITGRLVRNVAVPLADVRESPGTARAREIALVAEINRRYTPDDILEWHLNTNYYGSEAYGIEAAAQIYLGKRSVDLTLDEAALLAAIPTAPQYNPFSNEAAARGRQGDVLRAMRNEGMITQAEYETAAAVVTPITRGTYAPPLAPEYTVYARRQAETILTGLGYDGTRMVALGGLRITTALDLDLYFQALCTLQTQLARAGADVEPPDGCTGAAYLPNNTPTAGSTPPDTGALVVLDAETGTLKALVGAADVEAFQPGVTLQPFVYLGGFLDPSGAYTPATMVFDIPNQYPGAQEGLIYTVRGMDGRFRGPLNLRDAMGAYLLPPAAAIANEQGMNTILRTAHQLGLNSLDENRYDLMLLERGGAASVLDIAYAYSVFATLGDMRGVPVEPVARGYRGRDPAAVLRIEDADGNVLWAYDQAEAARCGTLDVCTPLLEDKLAYLVNDILADQETRWSVIGQGTALDLPRPGAVVSGTTLDGVDAWTVGYTPDYVVGVALSREDGEPTTLDPYGLAGSAPIWRAVTEYVHARANLPPSDWERPTDIVPQPVCEISGLLPNGVCPVRTEMFLDGTQPRTVDDHWQTVEITDTGQRASVTTPPERRQSVNYFIPPAGAAREWWVANNQPLPPEDYDDLSRPQIFETVRIARPSLFDYVGGEVEIYADMDTEGMQYYQVEYGQGLNPAQWFAIGGQQTNFNADQPVAVWNTNALDGIYSVRIITVLDDNSRDSDAIQVTVDNQSPSVTLDSVEPGKLYRWPQDDAVELEANVNDNLTIDRVEFYLGDALLGADVEFPFTLSWSIEGLGSYTFTAVAFDAVGNQAQDSLPVEILRSGS